MRCIFVLVPDFSAALTNKHQVFDRAAMLVATGRARGRCSFRVHALAQGELAQVNVFNPNEPRLLHQLGRNIAEVVLAVVRSAPTAMVRRRGKFECFAPPHGHHLVHFVAQRAAPFFVDFAYLDQQHGIGALGALGLAGDDGLVDPRGAVLR